MTATEWRMTRIPTLAGAAFVARDASMAEKLRVSDDIGTRAATVLTTTDDATAVTALERIAEGFRAAARAADIAPESANRFRQLGEELSSHALAAHFLITSGASRDSLHSVLEKARLILDSEGVGGLAFSPR